MRLVVLCLMRLSLVAGLTRSLAPRARCLGRRGGLVRAAGSEASSADVPDEGRTKQSRTREDRLNVGKAKAVARGNGAFRSALSLGGGDAAAVQNLRAPFLVLGIETSCDDTAAAVVSSDGRILGEAVVSQHEIHAKFGGIVPGLAKDAHEAAIDGVVACALAKAGLASAADVDVVAATVGPGLEICLRVGAKKAAALARAHEKVFVGAHHLEAHCLVSRLGDHPDAPQFPFLSLLVSGGHCQLLWCRNVGDFEVLGGTVDDALGEAYDKAARMLAIAAPTGGGPAIEALAVRGNATAIPLPVPLQKRKRDCDFSYAGLKNSFRGHVAAARERLGVGPEEPLPDADAADLAASFQRTAILHVEQRLAIAFPRVEQLLCEDQPRTLALVGGVAANAELRARVAAQCEKRGWRLAVPVPRLCTDNGVMVAWAAVEQLKLGLADETSEDQQVYARWPFKEHPSLFAE